MLVVILRFYLLQFTQIRAEQLEAVVLFWGLWLLLLYKLVLRRQFDFLGGLN